MTNTERVEYFKAALAILNINFEKDETYVSILAMADLIDNKQGQTTLQDISLKNTFYQNTFKGISTSNLDGGNVALYNEIVDKLT
jgi:hypothetical protein